LLRTNASSRLAFRFSIPARISGFAQERGAALFVGRSGCMRRFPLPHYFIFIIYFFIPWFRLNRIFLF
jgi:hypothetical protein